MDVSQANAEQATRDLAIHEGIFSGISAGGAVASAIELSKQVDDAVIVTIICDRGTGTFLQAFLKHKTLHFFIV